MVKPNDETLSFSALMILQILIILKNIINIASITLLIPALILLISQKNFTINLQ